MNPTVINKHFIFKPNSKEFVRTFFNNLTGNNDYAIYFCLTDC